MKIGLLELASCIILLCLCVAASAQQGSIVVHPEQVLVKQLSRYMTGACIEDVNHEIYGGIYSQMIFGESFQEPSLQPQIKGFRAYDGRWEVLAGELTGGDGPGPKLVSDYPAFADGEVGVEVF